MAKQSSQPRPTESSPHRATDAGTAVSNASSHLEQAVGVVIFRLGNTLFGIRLSAVSEIVRRLPLAYMPLAPRPILGLANFCGNVLPVVSLRRLIGLPDISDDDAGRIIVVEQGTPAGFAVDRVDSLMTVSAERIEASKAGAGGVDAGLLEGVIQRGEGLDAINVLDLKQLLRGQFVEGRAARPALGGTASGAGASQTRSDVSIDRKSFISFDIRPQEYALPLADVREIVTLPDHIPSVARAETAVLGVITLRDRLLPIISLRTLLGLPDDLVTSERGKVVVLALGRGTVGVVVDRTREILHIDVNLIDTAPTLLTRGTGDAEITALARLEKGKRLVAVLSPERLFRSELVNRILSEQDTQTTGPIEQTDSDAMTDQQFIVFRLGGQEYGMPIGAVDEIARPPERIAKLPKAPEFVEGVMNLRGNVVPVIDLRKRFSLVQAGTTQSQRVLVLSVAGSKTAFIVDAVSEVMKIPESAIQPSPELSEEQVRLIGSVANLETQNRMVLLVDPNQLLSQVETDVLRKFERTSVQKAAPAS